MIDENIKKQALKLSNQQRAELAHLLIDSLEPDKEFKSEDAWADELKDRIERYEKGSSPSTPWQEVKSNANSLLD